MNNFRTHILVCTGGGCIASGALEVKTALEEAIERKNLDKEVLIVGTGCLGPCAVGPVALVHPDGIFYEKLKPEDAAEIVDEHILKGRYVERLVHKKLTTEEVAARLQDIPFFRDQVKIVLRNCGRVDPTNIEEYIANDGYQGLAKALTEMTPEEVIAEIKKSGLRGRGGAGFPTGLKWEFCRKAKGDRKFTLCNADEGDPGAFMDRSVLEGDPHSIVEGMAIAAYAIGSSEGFVYCRAEYPLAIERLGIAIAQARDRGLLGKNILGTGFDFDIEIRKGSGAFVCGEETALMTSIEGNRGEPRPRPPFPANKGLWGMPSLLNNVETYANVPAILCKGADWYGSFGTEKSKGTKVFALAGAVTNTGLVEVPIGTTLGKLIYDIGGGIPGGKAFKAAQIGGPSGGCIPKEDLNVPLDYESLAELGAIMGSGGLIVIDEDTCMVDVARFFLDFVQDESCGKCVPCRIGTKRMLEILTRICEGRGEEGDIEKLEALGHMIKDTALCGLGQTAPNPVLSTIRHFRDEYEAHIHAKHCPASVCPDLVRAPCQNTCPAGVDVPGYVALIGERRYAEALRLHRERNPFVSVCSRVCFHPCEGKCRRSTLDEPVAIRGLKRFMAEQEVTVQLPEMRESDENARRKIAIVGAGPAGLSCGYFLARLGYRPKVFEAEERPGGMLIQTIPAYRLPRDIVTREIRMIERMGVEIETGVALGKDFTLKGLHDEGYEAVFLGVGAPYDSRLGIPGEDLDGMSQALEFLRIYNIHGSVPVTDDVVVLGGGNSAIDVARTAKRLGAKSVTVLYRRTRAQMPAFAEEVDEAEREGVVLKTLVSPVEIIGENGHVTGVTCRPMTLGEFDRSGRRRPVPSGEADFVVKADQVVAAIGQSLNPMEISDGVSLKLTKQNHIAADALTGQTSVEWVFTGGDAMTGPAYVAQAVAGGEKAAVGIDMYLTGETHAFWREDKEVDVSFDPDADPAPYPRAAIRLLSVTKRKENFDEVELPWSESTALRETKRCLRCDYREKTES